MTTTTTVIVDQDGGIDDALALVLLARAPGVEIVGVGSVHGNVTATAAADNGLRVLEIAGDHSTPVAVGASEPLARPLHLAHPEDLLRTAAGSPKRKPVGEETAAGQLVRLARENPGRVDLLTLGPLTNVALALDAEPELPRLVRRMVSMAGAFEVKGNISDCAESNVWHDPEAAARVVAAGFDLAVVPLDLTRKATVTRLWLEHLAADQDRLWGGWQRCSLPCQGSCRLSRCMIPWPPRSCSTRRSPRSAARRSRSSSGSGGVARPGLPRRRTRRRQLSPSSLIPAPCLTS
ncbi:hypothetical protein G3I59_09665 [Amycolatopsis rubida]|uniref:Inosine/uridine-preferring nucleoside hydrolase domain-containing protein n=1 Tax=Amycolatopsis rubida TaxID=112413 RepID=A0ABX0BKH7_9PSEU|nr:MULTISPECIES: nucleoside hydrolase [Amycolatopsis]MYW90860.1 hypothetical protein [Amycolatopsis rubida]NEC55845.1 hypothetical protein [Amycolatopsis rubida]OAP26074.1 Pyrimidine-specific ribonucleoside hydrolase RihB [Amycolatopsis sp. M39]